MVGSGALTRWRGSYAYPPGTPGLAFERVPFVMTLRHGWFGGITGSIEDGEGGIPDPARVSGRFRGTSIRFRKVYPRVWLPGIDGRLICVPIAAPSTVLYAGTASFDRRSIEGTWSIAGGVFEHAGQWFETPAVSGSWEAQQVDERSAV
jgi:hypothetical protein